jgi:hypothetical protein
MAFNAKERYNSGTRGSRFTAFRIEELHPTFSAETEGVESARASKRRLEGLLQAVAEMLPSLFSTSSRSCYNAG